MIASCGNDNLVKLWSAADGSPVRTLEGHDVARLQRRVPPGRQTGSSLRDLKGVVKDWDWRPGKLRPRPRRQGAAQVRHRLHGRHRRRPRHGVHPRRRRGSRAAGITNVSNAFAGVGNPLVVLFDWDDGQVEARSSRRTPSRERRGASRSTRWAS